MKPLAWLVSFLVLSVECFTPVVMTATADSRTESEKQAESDCNEEEPLQVLYDFPKEMRDPNELINTGIIVAIAIAVLWKLATIDAGIWRGWTAEEMATRAPLDVWASYTSVLKESPVATKAATSATVYTIGDVIAQRTEGVSVGKLDRARIFRSMLAGLIGHGPLSHYWYIFCDDIFDNVLQWTSWWSFIPKVFLDQTTWGPIWNNIYILLIGIMKLESPLKIWEDMKRTTIPLIVSGLKLWPLAHCVTYGLIPVENRLLWVDIVEIIWVVILSTQAAKSNTSDKEKAH